MVKHVGKRGDTLIEVMLAVGIFSMVAVAIVSVMSGSTSNAQTALETTLAREEIDAQAEALRFIQSSYIAEKDDTDGKFAQLWKLITAADPTNSSNVNVVTRDNIAAIAQYSPSECSNLYNTTDGEARQYGFILDVRKLGSFTNPNEIIVTGQQKTGEKYTLDPASIYPRLFYSDDDSLVASGNTLDKAEGIYIIAVKDPDSTTIAGTNKSAYYDFYIRTCWYGTGDQAPSTISTVIRLYDPDAIKTK